MTETQHGESPRTEAVLSALASGERRAVLRELADADGGEMGTTALSEAVFSRLNGDGPDGSTEERRQLRLALHHKHLPKLEHAGLIDQDGASDRITLTDGELADDLLELIDSRSAAE